MYYVFRVATMAVPWLPEWLAHPLGVAAGWIAWCVARNARQHAVKNMVHVLGPQMRETRAGRKRLRHTVQAMFQHNVLNTLAVFSLPARTPAAILHDLHVEGVEHLDAALAQGKGVICFTAHLGPIDYLMQWLALHGYDVTVPVERLKDPRILDLMLRMRGFYGLHLLPLDGSTSIRPLVQQLRRNHIVGLTADRGIQGQTSEMAFFGAPACLPLGPVLLAQRTGAALVGGFGWRTTGGRINGHFFPLSLELAEEQHATTASLQQRIVSRLEQVIRAHPEQWMAFEPIWMETPGGHSHEIEA
jgi:lauroyl/myristoyl acyltransferase